MLIAFWLVAPVSGAGILVIAPHPDDDIITSAGVISRAIGREEVTVVFVTNGDVGGTSQGYLRQAEAVAAQVGHLGTREDDLIFLGYPDAYLQPIYDNYVSSSSQFFTPSGQGFTYGNRGLGRKDYHSYRFGAPAAYNRANIVTDLATILKAYRPSQIYTLSEFDKHKDHATTYRLLRKALDQARSQDPSYAPVINKTIVWANTPGQEVTWPAATDPAAYNVEIPGLSVTGLVWQDRESLDVPAGMQDPNLALNVKYQAILAHASQAGGSASLILRFAHKDEIFWSENPFGANRPPVAEAGNNVVATPGQFVQLDGAASRDPEGAALKYLWTQVSGPPVSLLDGTTARPGFIVPANASRGDAWSFQLEVSDGLLKSATDMVHVFAGTRDDNIARVASVTASSQNVNSGQLAGKAVDGIADGYPGDSTREWATVGEGAGAWIRLEWGTPYTVDRVVLYDRPNSNDQVLAGKLTFSDGSTVSVGALDNAGGATTVSFSARSITTATFKITSVSGKTRNIGLAEMEVHASGVSGLDTVPPSLPGDLRVSSTTSNSVALAWTASSDTGGSGLAGYRVYRDGSTTPRAIVTGTSFTDTGLAAATAYSYRLKAYDGAGNESQAAGPVTGTTQPAGGAAGNVALAAKVTASSQNTGTAQLASKAVDGVVDGYPGDSTREWATLGERAGAWLRLSLDKSYTVDRVILYDRPNVNDQVLSGTLTFGDGSSVVVGSLNNAGSGVTVSFAPRTVDNVTFTITSVSGKTLNVGLAEIQVFGSSTP